MSIVSIYKAKTDLSKLIQEAINGGEVIIRNRNIPVVKLVPIPKKTRKELAGTFRGQIWISDDFNEIPDCFSDYI
jgi:prevent-host-death family protein